MSYELALVGIPNKLEHLAHAYIVEGTDKQALFQQAELLAETLLCSTNFKGAISASNGSANDLSAPCGHCHSCQLFQAKSHPDYLLAQAEKTSIGVDDIRQVSTFLTKTSQLSGNQVVVIDQAQLMTESASNALLKTLEEPTDKSYLLLLTDSKNKLLATILSRCQFLTLDTLSKEQLKQKYSELPDYLLGYGYKSESDILRWIESEKVEEFNEIYQLFIKWLKRQTPVTTIANKIASDIELHDFFLYLVSRRIRQLMLKSSSSNANAEQANLIVNQYVKTQRHIVGINKPLALNALLSQLNAKI